jgi:hypothetical protein
MSRRVEVILALDPAPYVAGGARAVTVNRQIESSVDKVNTTARRAAVGTKQFGDDSVRGFSRSAVAAALMESSLSKVATTAAGFFSAQIFLGGVRRVMDGIRSAIQGGLDLNETLTKTGFAFGPSADLIIQQSDQMADRFGTNRQVFLDSATQIGLIGKAAGLAAPQAAVMGANFAKLAADVTSFHNVPLVESLGAIRSGLVGESEPLRRYGVLLSESAVQAEAVALGLAATGAELSEQQKVVARASLIQKGFADASGDLARTQDSLANRLRAMQGHAANFAAEIGLKAQPALGALLDVSYQLSQDGLQLLEDAFRRLGPGLHDLIEAGRDLGPIFRSVLDVIGPLGAALGTVGGGAIVGTLNTVASVLQATTGFLADHEVVVQAVAAAYLGRFIPALVVGAQALQFQAFSAAETGALRLMYAVDGLSTRFGFMTGASQLAASGVTAVATAQTAAAGASGLLFNGLAAVGSVMTALAPAALIGSLVYVATQLDNVAEDAERTKKALESVGNTQSFGGFETRIAAARDKVAQARTQVEEYKQSLESGWNPTTKPIVSFLDKITGNVDESVGALRAAEAVLAGTSTQFAAFKRNIIEVQRATGLTTPAILDLARANGIDLATAGKSAIEVLKLLGGQAAATAAQAETAAARTARIDILKQAADQALDLGSALSSVVSRHNSLDTARSKTSGETALEREHKIQGAYLGVQHAQARLVDATIALTRLREDAASGRLLLDAERQVAAAFSNTQHALDRLYDAQQALEDLRRSIASGRSLEEIEIAYQRAVLRSQEATDAVTQAELKLEAARDHGTAQEQADSERELASARLDQKEAGFALQDAQTAVNRAQGQGGTIARELADAEREAADASRSLVDAQAQEQTAQQALNDLRDGGVARQLTAATLDYQQAVLGVAQAQDAVASALAKTSEASASQRAKFDASKVSLTEFGRELEKQIKVFTSWNTDLLEIADTVRQKYGTEVAKNVVDDLRTMGIEGAGIVHQLANAHGSEFDRIVQLVSTRAAITKDNFTGVLDQMFQIATGQMKTGGFNMGAGLEGALGGKVADANQVMVMFFQGLVTMANAVLQGVGAPKIPYDVLTGRAPGQGFVLHAKGGVDAHIVSSPTVLYGERSTKREAFVPQEGISAAQARPILQEAAGWHGMAVVPMARGGVLPALDNLAPYGDIAGRTGTEAERYTRDRVAHFLDRHSGSIGHDGGAAVPYGGGQIGSGWRAITGYLDSIGAQYIVTSTTGGRHAPGSKHYEAKATDLVGRGAWSMLDLFNALGPRGGNPLSGIDELFFDPPGFYYDRGVRRSGRIGGHGDHVHAATFDEGGWLPPYSTTLATNNTAHWERVEPRGGGGVVVQMVPGMVVLEAHISADADAALWERVAERVIEPALEKLGTQVAQKVRAMRGGG